MRSNELIAVECQKAKCQFTILLETESISNKTAASSFKITVLRIGSSYVTIV